MIKKITYGSRQLNKLLDDTLMVTNKFQSQTLMQIAGIAVAQVAHLIMNRNNVGSVCVLVGPGNNGGDGLVAARHLKMFGYKVGLLVFKKLQGKNAIFQQLCNLNSIESKTVQDLGLPNQQLAKQNFTKLMNSYQFIIDGIFGFPFVGEIRPPYKHFIPLLKEHEKRILSIDIPSGWDANEGNIHNIFCPSYLISLGLPKNCSEKFQGQHYFGGRFVPLKIAEQLNITLPQFKGCQLYTRL